MVADLRRTARCPRMAEGLRRIDPLLRTEAGHLRIDRLAHRVAVVASIVEAAGCLVTVVEVERLRHGVAVVAEAGEADVRPLVAATAVTAKIIEKRLAPLEFGRRFLFVHSL